LIGHSAVKIDCLLVSPPAWYPYQPYMALPTLQGHLRGQGFSTRILDLNLEYLDAQLNRGALEATLQKAEERTFSSSPAWMSEAQQKARERFYRKLALVSADLLDQVDVAVRVLRGPEYYDYGRRAEATKVVYWALQAVTACYYPTVYDGNDLRPRLNPYHPAQLLELVGSPEENPFLEYLEAALRLALARERPLAVGIGICGPSQLVGGLTVASVVKRLAPDVHVIVGGSFFSRLETAVRRFPEVFALVDSIIMYEGEIALGEVLARLKNGAALADVRQRIGRNATTGEVEANLQPALPEIDALPAPDYDGMALDKYLAPTPILSVASSRGCYWRRCAFCDHGFCYQGNYRERAVEKVVADVVALEQRWGSGRYEFVDEALEPLRTEEIARALLAAGLDVQWFGLARVDRRFTPARFAAARQAGCRLLSFGVESHDNGVLRAMRKGTTAQLNLQVLRACHEADIRTHIMVFFGFPGESSAAGDETASLIDRHADVFDDASAAPFSLGRQSGVMKELAHFGVEPPPGWEDSPELGYALSIPYSVHGADTAAAATARARDFKAKVTQKKAALDRTTAFLYACRFGHVGVSAILSELEAHGREKHLPRLDADQASECR
jgi:anaerobic magnesium-protoporphyrin IX monomethyl ester cyclase